MNETTQPTVAGTINVPPPGFVGRRTRRPVRKRVARISVSARDFYQPLPLWVWLATGLLMVAGAFSKNPGLTTAAILMLPVLASLLWFKGEPPVMVLACTMQWLQASVAIFYVDFHGLTMEEAAGYQEFVTATWLSLLGILVLAVGMRLALVGRRDTVMADVAREGQQLEPGRIFGLYLGTFLLFSMLTKVASLVPGLAQPILALGSIKWVMVFLLTYAVLQRRQGYGLLALCVGLELVVGFIGFFSGFKQIFMILLTVLPTAGYAFRGWRVVQVTVLAVVLVALSIMWTVVKVDYREFLNRGSGEQEVNVPIAERIEVLRDLVEKMDAESIQKGVETLVLRVNYVNYFALCLMNIPANLPFAHGKLWGEAIERTFKPRFLFPEKTAIDDSERTSYYTGVYVAGAEQGTSISIGYMGESYIDYGKVGMFVPVLLLGLFYGCIYRYFVHFPHPVMGFAMATAILLFGAYQLETSNIKLVGGNLMTFLVLAFVSKLTGETVWRMMLRRDGGKRPAMKSPPLKAENRSWEAGVR